MRILTQQVGDGAATLTCYVPDVSTEMPTASVRPFALVLPGGGYSFTSDREAEPVALAYLAEGFAAGVLRYAVGPESTYDDAFRDARAALAWVREHADELTADPAKVVAVGFSAGGHLAGSLGILADDKPDALVLGYPVTLAEFHMDKGIPDLPSAVTPDTPPTFVFHTYADSLVPVRHTVALTAALADAEVPFESHVYLLGPHGISLAKGHTASGVPGHVDAAAASWHADSVRFLRDVFGEFATFGVREGYGELLGRRRIGLDMPLGRLVAHERARDVLASRSPQFLAAADNPMALGLSLRQIAVLQPGIVTTDQLDALATDLDALN